MTATSPRAVTNQAQVETKTAAGSYASSICTHDIDVLKILTGEQKKDITNVLFKHIPQNNNTCSYNLEGMGISTNKEMDTPQSNHKHNCCNEKLEENKPYKDLTMLDSSSNKRNSVPLIIQDTSIWYQDASLIEKKEYVNDRSRLYYIKEIL